MRAIPGRSIAALLMVAASSPAAEIVGNIEFFGTDGRNVTSIRRALPLREGDPFPLSDEERSEAIIRTLREAVARETGEPPTDIGAACCDRDGNWILHIGLARPNTPQFRWNAVPQGQALLPDNGVQLYDATMDAVQEAVRHSPGEDHSKGYALATDANLRSKQQALREYALRNEGAVYEVLASSASDQHRAAAAHILGYANYSERQVRALSHASRDPYPLVRNNAIRALMVLATGHTDVSKYIAAEQFVPFLRSGKWTDRNKAVGLLVALTHGRDPALLAALRPALPDLIEMASWRDRAQAEGARTLLGRMAGMEEARIQELLNSGSPDEFLLSAARLQSAPPARR